MGRQNAGLIAASVAALAISAFASSACFAQLPGAVGSYASDADSSLPNVAPGDHIAIACDSIEQRGKDSDVRVVLTIAAVPGESAPGYKKVLATDAELLKDAVRVRIPDVPDIDEHTVDLNVYVVSDKGSQRCNAGQMKIS